MPAPRSLSLILGALVMFQLGALLEHFIPDHAAMADPIGMSVSGGKNPLVTISGNTSSTSSSNAVYTVPSDRILVITDIDVGGTNTGSTSYYDNFYLYDGSAGKYLYATSWTRPTASYYALNSHTHMTSGLVVPASTSLRAFTARGYDTVYTISGYLARP